MLRTPTKKEKDVVGGGAVLALFVRRLPPLRSAIPRRTTSVFTRDAYVHLRMHTDRRRGLCFFHARRERTGRRISFRSFKKFFKLVSNVYVSFRVNLPLLSLLSLFLFPSSNVPLVSSSSSRSPLPFVLLSRTRSNEKEKKRLLE